MGFFLYLKVLCWRPGSRIFRKAQPEHQGRCQEPVDDGREYGQASAEPAAGIQDFQEGAAGAPGQDAGTRPTKAGNMARLQ